MIDYLDQLDIHAVLATVLCVLMSFFVPPAFVLAFLAGSLLMPQGIILARAFERAQSQRPVRAYLVLNEALVFAIIAAAVYLRAGF